MLTLLINLESAALRRQAMEARLAAEGIVAERVGVDLRTSTLAGVQAWFARYPNLAFVPGSICAAEAGCWASHLSAWQFVRDSGAPGGIILEDDIVLGPGFRDAVRACEDPTPFDVIYLGTSSRNISSRRRTQVGGTWVHRPIGVIFNTWGYVITRAYIERLFAAPLVRIDMPVDHFLGGRARTVKPRIGVVRPGVVTEDAATGVRSQIQPYATRMDRHPWWQATRRMLLASRLSDLYYSLYRWL